MYGQNSQRIFSSNEDVSPLIQIKWDFALRSLVVSNIVADSKFFYCVITDSDLNGLVMLDKSNGRVTNTPIILPQSYTYTIAIDENCIYVASGELINVYNVETRLLAWDKEFEGEVVFSIVPDDNLLYGISSSGKVFSLHTDTGEFKWNWKLDPDYVYRFMTKTRNMIIVSGNKKGTQEQIYTAIDAKFGDYLWSKFLIGSLETPPQIEKNRLFLTASIGIICCDLLSGANIWTYFYPTDEESLQQLQLETIPSILDDSIFVVVGGKVVELSIDYGLVEDEIIVPQIQKVKFLIVTPRTLVLALDGEAFLYTYDRVNKRFAVKLTGKRMVQGCAISDGICLQSQESIAFFK
jgi:outer membrane protein assembly factor BamB